LELCENHGAVVALVVEFHALNEVFNGALILFFLDLAEDRQEFVSLDLLLSCWMNATFKNNVQSKQEITKKQTYPSSLCHPFSRFEPRWGLG
jgi:hypothetical protein